MSDLANIWTKSNCLTKNQLQQYLEQKLDREEVYLIESHLNDCPLCNDAIEGLLQTNKAETDKNLHELKSKFESKLSELKPIEKQKTNYTGQSSIKPKNNNETKPLKTHKGKKFRWVYAASILLVIGLGYSVFSFIKDYKQKSELAQHKESPKIKSGEPKYTPMPDSSHENIHIEASVEDVNELQGIDSDLKTKATNRSSLAITEPQSNIKTTTTPSNKQVEQVDNLANDVKETPTSSVASNPIVSPKYESGAMENYSKEEVQKEDLEKSKITSKKQPAGYGMKKNATVPQVQSNASNQLNYSSNATNEKDNSENSTLDNVQTKNKSDNFNQNNEAENFSHAVNLFEKGNYKRAIRQFEKLLPQSKGTEREDILFYTGMSYLRLDNTSKAKLYFSQLCGSAKYSKISSPYCSEKNQETKPAKK